MVANAYIFDLESVQNGSIAVSKPQTVPPPSNLHSFVHFLKACRDISAKVGRIQYHLHRQYLIGILRKSDDFIRILGLRIRANGIKKLN
jgi:hypothetical protein